MYWTDNHVVMNPNKNKVCFPITETRKPYAYI